MFTQKRALFIFVLAVLVVSFFVYSFVFQNTHSDKISSFELRKKEEIHGQSVTYEVVSQDMQGLLTISYDAEKAFADQMVNSIYFGVKSSYSNQVAPYAGQISRDIVCGTKAFLKESSHKYSGEDSQVIRTVVNDRFLYGICSPEEVKYVALYWAHYDSSKKQILYLKLFKDVSNPSKIEKTQEEILHKFEEIVAQL